jgi:hypothetical protein
VDKLNKLAPVEEEEKEKLMLDKGGGQSSSMKNRAGRSNTWLKGGIGKGEDVPAKAQNGLSRLDTVDENGETVSAPAITSNSNRFAVGVKAGGFKKLQHRRVSSALTGRKAPESNAETADFQQGNRVKIIKQGTYHGQTATVSSEKEWFGRIKVTLDSTGVEKSYKATELVLRQKVLKDELKTATHFMMMYGGVKKKTDAEEKRKGLAEKEKNEKAGGGDDGVSRKGSMFTPLKHSRKQSIEVGQRTAADVEKSAQDRKMQFWAQTKKAEEERLLQAKLEAEQTAADTPEKDIALARKAVFAFTQPSPASVAAARLLVRSRLSVMKREKAANEALLHKARALKLQQLTEQRGFNAAGAAAVESVELAEAEAEVNEGKMNKSTLQGMVRSKTAREEGHSKEKPASPKRQNGRNNGKESGCAVDRDPMMMMGKNTHSGTTATEEAKQRDAYYGKRTTLQTANE